MISVTGIGWISDGEYGHIIGKVKKRHEGIDSLYPLFKRESLFSYPVKNFSRFDAISKTTCFCTALALKDAGITYSAGGKMDIGIFGANESGCLESNINYFKDYIESGRILARGNLFIYTLPSIPLAEAAIHFGLSGPLLHICFSGRKIPSLLSFAGKSIIEGEAGAILAVVAEETDAVCFLLEKERAVSSGKRINLADVSSVASGPDFFKMTAALYGLAKT
jgi:hypothetical protein